MASAILITEVFPPRTGGSGRWFWEIYRRLPRRDARIVAGEHPGQREFDASHALRLVRLPLTFPSWGLLNLKSSLTYVQAFARLRRLLYTEPATALHCGRCLPEGLLGFLVKQWARIPYLCYVHGEELTYAAFSRELHWLMALVFRQTSFVIANSENTATLLRREWRLSASRVKVLHPGVDSARFRPAARSADVRGRLGWGERPVVLTVGRLEKRKGHDMLIRALPAIKRALPDVLYAIIGSGEERSALEALVARQGVGEHVLFHGELRDDDLPACYQQCDLFALPNRQVGKDFEGFGMVLVEAQACGKPVVAGTSGGTAETMRVGKTGFVVPCDSPDPLAALLIELLKDPARLQSMGRAARAWAVERFDWTNLTKQAQQLFGTCSKVSRDVA